MNQDFFFGIKQTFISNALQSSLLYLVNENQYHFTVITNFLLTEPEASFVVLEKKQFEFSETSVYYLTKKIVAS